mmetsp:Transcript_8257/g.17609  ORF Transcript_8257/g.17609 Transcript_8257/m.17609 type:complete len:555 (+) Transcript_8257:1885-3549(+)
MPAGGRTDVFTKSSCRRQHQQPREEVNDRASNCDIPHSTIAVSHPMKPDDLIYLSDVIDRRNREASKSRPHSEARICWGTLSEDGALESFTTYEQARIVLGSHRAWLQRNVRGVLPKRNVQRNDDNLFAPSTVIAYISTNSADFFLSVLSSCSGWIPSSSCIPALLNARWTPKEMAQVLTPSCETDATLVLYGPQFRQTAEQVIRRLHAAGFKACHCLPIPEFSLGGRISAVDGEQPVVSSSPHSVGPSPSPRVHAQETIRILATATRPTNQQEDKSNHRHNDDALILFTSGTTSGSKGCRLSHASLLIQALAKLSKPCEYSHETTMLASTLPFYHVGGLTSILAIWLAGGSLLLRSHFPPAGSVTVPRFDPNFVWQSLLRESCNTLVVVPTMLHALQKVSVGILSSKVFPQVQLILIGGQSASSALVQFCIRMFPQARLIQTYACTEAASSLTFHDLRNSIPPSNPHRDQSTAAAVVGDCVGKPPSHVELAIVHKNNNNNNNNDNNNNNNNSNSNSNSSNHNNKKCKCARHPCPLHSLTTFVAMDVRRNNPSG